ncbi:unnamed protein product [Pseudo-nitzschia multistriata]|uniref:Peptidase S1 domain-containing protein n=1 Tax=Pseudo-nitzschia multistriata TaxID=183589 RepID=A0A448ZAT5_9STRA|nr:unnamed protein product [Pseudo-nitzschia multistriata]
MFSVSKNLFHAVVAATATIHSVFASPLLEKSIINGVESQPGQFPYFVYFGEGCIGSSHGGPNSPPAGCSGSLIAPDIVLTAGHGGNLTNVLISVGATKQHMSDDSGAQIRTCEEWVRHPGFGDFNNDFALCKLNETAIIDESFVRLELNDDASSPPDGTDLIAMGLGVIDNDLNFAKVLRNVTIPTRSLETCQNVYEKYIEILPETMLCLEYNTGTNMATCFADNGAPVVKRVYQGDGSFVDIHYGLASLGLHSDVSVCSDDILARTSGAIDWIKSTSCDTLNSVGSFCKKKTPKKTKAPKHTKASKRTKAPKRS